MIMKKNGLGLGIFIGILIALVIGMGSYFIYDRILSNDYNEEKNKGTTGNQDISEVLDVNSKLVQQLYSYVDNVGCSDVRKVFYEKDKLKMNELKNEYKLYLAMLPLIIEDSTDENVSRYSIDRFEENMNKIFGSNVSYVKETTTLFPSIEFNNNEVIVYTGAGCGAGEGYETKIVSAKKYDNKIEIDEKHIYYITAVGSDGGPGIYKEFASVSDNPIGVEPFLEYKVSYIDKYENDVPTYRFTYNLNEHGDYYLYSVERI